MSEAVKVMVRCRPMNSKEIDRGCKGIVEVDMRNRQINLMKEQSREQPKSFAFDYVFGAESAQSVIYEQSAFTLVDSVLEGYNGTIFAYGQTGCGKTHTMMGAEGEANKGIIPRTFSQIMTTAKSSGKTHLIRCSFLEIYNQEIRDLLGKDTKQRLDLKESPEKGVFVKDLLQIEVDNINKMEEYMAIGFRNRATRSTNMNNESSRSHSIFTIYIDSQELDSLGNEKYKASKLNLVDLAGSERANKTGVSGQGLKEATKINLSLSALGNVISALVDGKTQHIPYRDSKLTRLLQDSLGGNTKTIMIAAVSPASDNYEETLSTLRYASRAKFIQNKPKINEDPKDALLREYMEEIKRLKLMLEGKLPIGVTSAVNSDSRVSGEGKARDSSLEEELREKENLLRTEQEEKRLLEEKLGQLEQSLAKPPLPSQKDASEMERIRKLKEKLREQKKKEEEYMREKQRRESELLSIEKNYKSLNEEVDDMREHFQEIKKKYVANLAELRDLQVEHENEKEDLLDTIRYQEKEIKKFNAIMAILMSQDNLDLIINNSEWDEEKGEWTIPNFTYKEKTVTLPKLKGGREASDSSHNLKEVRFAESKTFLDTKTSTQRDTPRLINIIREARDESLSVSTNVTYRTNSYAKGTHLTPLKNESADRIKIPFPNDEKKKRIERLKPINLAIPIDGEFS